MHTTEVQVGMVLSRSAVIPVAVRTSSGERSFGDCTSFEPHVGHLLALGSDRLQEASCAWNSQVLIDLRRAGAQVLLGPEPRGPATTLIVGQEGSLGRRPWPSEVGIGRMAFAERRCLEDLHCLCRSPIRGAGRAFGAHESAWKRSSSSLALVRCDSSVHSEACRHSSSCRRLEQG